MADGDRLPLEPTPEMIAAGADALEHVNDIGRWLAESLAASVLERAFEAHRTAQRVSTVAETGGASGMRVGALALPRRGGR